MSPDLDTGLIAITIAVILSIIGLVLWLIAAGHLDEIEDARTPPAGVRRTGTRVRPTRSTARVPSSQQRIREGLAEWRGTRGPYVPTSSVESMTPPRRTVGKRTSSTCGQPVAPDLGRRDLDRDS